ncbi:hypothetical protein OCK02_21175 [Rhizobium sp. TRM96647]|uniref:hypothetical protein n=1 Tax=unclassified Rhizobium TaxID=2613769 RepID=UPI0021E8ADCB|nr:MULTISPECIES: hypothetical protein [unclassified Rhizobium]MCV3738706.1 hypothetical protein [Rhizobium sp. TRM96647]MCV3760393.1 hypothetical protein [Rhizobium sp. TRM96650]
MNTIVMIILTLLPSGDLSSSFVNVDTIGECEQRLQRIRPILESSNTLREAGCFKSEAQFGLFDHDPPAGAPRYDFLVSFDGDLAVVGKVKSAEDCRQAQERKPTSEGQRHFCTTSTQDMAGNGK